MDRTGAASRMSKECFECGTRYYRKPHDDYRHWFTSKFCSRDCRGAHDSGRLWSAVRIGLGVDDCWIWTSGKTTHGYGTVRGQLAHRAAWMREHGPIPEGLGVLHRCDNPPCVRPDHLFLGTPKDNKADCVSKGRHAWGENFGTSKLTNEKAAEVKTLLSQGVGVCEVARRFGMSSTAISEIKAGRTWRRVAVAQKLQPQGSDQ